MGLAYSARSPTFLRKDGEKMVKASQVLDRVRAGDCSLVFVRQEGSVPA
jgi:hypothetical protein